MINDIWLNDSFTVLHYIFFSVQAQSQETDSLESRAELAVLRIYVEDQAILEPILLYWASKGKQTKEWAARTVYGLIFLPFYKILFSFFSFLCQDAHKTRSNWATIGCNLSKKQKLTLYKTQNRMYNYVDQTSLTFTRSYLPVQNLGERHPNTIELASCLVHVLRDFKAT